MTDQLFRFYDALANEQFLMEYLDEDSWNALLAVAEKFQFAAGDTIFEVDDATRLMYILVEGTVEVLVDEDGSARPKCIDTIEAPNVFGEQTFLDGGPRTARIAARTDCTCHCLRIGGLQQLIRQNPGLASVFLFDLARVLSLRFRAWQ